MKILNLYACLGGNRYKWGDDHNVTAVEIDPYLAKLYQERFPNDNVIVFDAHQFLLEHFHEYDFIWSSPPCPTHSRARFWSSKGGRCEHIYPDMTLYQEIIFLNNFFSGKYCVENVIPYYDPLIPAQKRGRHLYWTNFNLPNDLGCRKSPSMQSDNEVDKWCEFHQFDFRKYKGEQRLDKIARNLVDFEAGKTILETALGIIVNKNINQLSLL